MALIEFRSCVLAVELVRRGARFVVVGSTARRLLEPDARRPRDLDVVITPDDVTALVAAFARLDVHVSPARLLRANPTTVATGWCPVDVFVAPPPRSRPVVLTGCTLRVLDAR